MAATLWEKTCRAHPDMRFSAWPGRDLLLDLFVPIDTPAPPLALVIHGGGWRQGNRKDTGLEWLVGEGFAIARIEYRHSSEAPFPAQIEDCAAALEWLRRKSDEFGFDSSRTVAVGTSAGGTLALLLGVRRLVCAVVAYCAPCDLPLRALSQPHLTETPGGIVHDLLGGPLASRLALAHAASPACLVAPGAAPSLLIHGTADAQVLADQPLAYLRAALCVGLEVGVISVPGAGHCGDAFHAPHLRSQVAAFLHRHTPLE